MAYLPNLSEWNIEPAREPPRKRDLGRLLTIDAKARSFRDRALSDLPAALTPGDLLVLNDAATLPASLTAQAHGQELEIRLLAQVSETRWQVVLFGAGDWTVPTERRLLPPALDVGHVLALSGMHAYVVQRSAVSPRLLELEFDRRGDEFLQALYGQGAPVQYSYQRSPLALWSVQTSYASRPWAVEMPSAGQPLSFRMLSALRKHGVTLANLTHAAGLSSTGDPALDRMLPLPERYDIPARTISLIRAARGRRGRVIAVGTSVVRALEGSFRTHGDLTAGSGTTRLRLTATSKLQVVDGLLSGVHVPGESHYDLLRAFADEALLRGALEHAAAAGYRAHEFGDSTLVLSRTA